ncbi:MAG: GYF domain-containing protein, partial [Planctomycetota bacterium]
MQWYLSYDGNQIGPMDDAEARAKAEANPNGLCWREGFAEWIPIRNAYELSARGPRPAAPPPPGSAQTADEIDFSVHGESTQFVEIELDPGESAVAEAGAMMYKDRVIEMESVFGDGRQDESPGLMDRLVGAGKRLITGESLFITVFTHRGSS